MASILDRKTVPLLNWVITSVALSALLTIFVFVIRAKFLPPQIPLFYGLAQGESQLASTSFIFLPILISVGLLLANIFISIFLKDDFLKKTLVASGIVTIIFCLVTVLRIIFLVGSL